MREAFELNGPGGQPVTVTLKWNGAREWIDHIVRQAKAASEALAVNPASPNPGRDVSPPCEAEAEDLSRGESLYASIVGAERERHRREMEAWRTEFGRGYLRPTRNALAHELVDIEAAKASRPAIGKPLSRRARRRNRGRVSAARVALARIYHEPVTWAWPAQGSFHG